jgi:hypothetical protein
VARTSLLAFTLLCLSPHFEEASASPVIPELSVGTAWSGAMQPDTPGPAEVDLAPYGQPEDRGAYPPDGGLLLAVRFDLPFSVPYEITKVSFPSFTSSGVPAAFESVSLCELDPAVGLIRLGSPIVKVTPFVGSPDGWNEIPVNTTVHDPDRILFLCFAFPSASTAEDRPMLRWDFRTTELGEFGASYSVHTSGRPIGNFGGNLVASMRCHLGDRDILPLEPSQGFGASRVQDGIEFYFTPSRNIRSDSLASQPDALERTDLIFRAGAGPWSVVGSAPRHADRLQLGISAWDSLSVASNGYYATQSVSRTGTRSIPSNVVWVPFRSHHWFADDQVHANGMPSEATPINPCRAACTSVDAALFPAGDRDFWSFEAVPGESLLAVFIPPPSVYNSVSPTMELYDWKERLVARSEGTFRLDYVVPPRHGNDRSGRYLLLVRDGLTTPSGAPAPRLLNPPWYNIRVHGSSRVTAVRHTGPLGVANGKNGTVSFRYQEPSTPRGSRHRLQIFDVHGRLIRTLKDTTGEGLIRTAIWDLKDNMGSAVRSGIYFAQLQLGDTRAIRRITVIR